MKYDEDPTKLISIVSMTGCDFPSDVNLIVCYNIERLYVKEQEMKKKVIPAVIIIALIILFGGIFALQEYNKKFSYSDEVADLDSYFGVRSAQDVPIVLGDETIEEHARLIDNTYYMDFASVRKYLNRRFYYGEEDGLLIYTTATEVIYAPVGEKSWYDSAGASGDEDYVISRMEDGSLFVALDYVKKYTNFAYEGYLVPNHLVLTTSWEDKETATVTKDTEVRLRGGIKSEILREIEVDETVDVLEVMDTWTKVATDDGYIGYIENKKLSEPKTSSPIPVTDYVEPEYASQMRDHRINLGFHQIGGRGGNATITDAVALEKSLNVIAPTWWAVTGNDGSIRSFGEATYVDAAHARGYEVWALLDNFTGGEDFSTHEVLSHEESRQNLVDNVVSDALSLGVDGINLDFELVAPEDGQSFVQFMRELSIACRREGLVFSIDNYVPMNFNDYYDLTEQGVYADYVIIMGYDEHYAGSAEAGSVASISYVENGILDAIEEVDPAKVINALPFYTRIWHTKDGQVTSEAVHMKTAKEYIANHNIDMQWDSASGQYYGEFTDADGTLNQLWMEEEESIGQKVETMSANGIGGVAEWSLGMETPGVWDIIEAFVNE